MYSNTSTTELPQQAPLPHIHTLAYVYPGWHESSYRTGQNEWNLLKSPSRYFPGHAKPDTPRDGFYDDSHFSTVQRQMDTAIMYGINGFNYFYYHGPNGPVMDTPFRHGLNYAQDRQGLKVNMCWCARLPIRSFPIRLSDRSLYSEGSRMLDLHAGRTPYLDDRVREIIFTSWCTNILSSKGYTRINNRPIISILNIAIFSWLYGVLGLCFVIQQLRDIVHACLGLDPYLVGICPDLSPNNLTLMKELPFDAYSGYGLLPDWHGPQIQDYKTRSVMSIEQWYLAEEMTRRPFLPVVVAGWDASCRGEHVHDFKAIRGFPWTPIVHNFSLSAFDDYVGAAYKFYEFKHKSEQIIFFHAWNEWSEGSSIEPSVRHGDALLSIINKHAARAQLRA